MKKYLFILLLCLSGMISTSFATSSATSTQQSATAPSDRAIIAWLVVLNQSEINAAKVAKRKQINKLVRAYAQMLYMQHTKNLQETYNVSRRIKAAPLTTSLSTSLQQDSDKELGALKQLNHQQFDNTFINSMIVGHTAGLHKIDKLLKQVSNPQLIHELKITRDMVAYHLERAKEIQKALNLNQ